MKPNSPLSRSRWIRSLIAGCLLTSGVIHAEEKRADPTVAFPGLAGLVIAGQQGAVGEQISYDPALSKIINRPLNELTGEEKEANVDVVRLLSAKLDRNSENWYLVDFDPGPSSDPTFVITDEKSGKCVGKIGADALVLPGNGFIYASGRTNNMHLERQKFAIREGELVEVEQPFSYVGLDSKANVALTLKAEKGSGETIAQIPKGDTLHVVLRDKEYLLIKTRFGLVGWWKMNTGVMAGNAEIDGIYYAGD